MTPGDSHTPRPGAAPIYLLAGLATWPVATAAIYYADRFANALATLGPPPPSIGLWRASAYALAFCTLVIAAGWAQSGTRPKP